MTELLRTSRDGCWSLKENTWGRFLAPCADPDANVVITEEQLEGFELHENTPKIPASLWNRWINLCIELMKRGTGDLEVSCRLLRKEDDPAWYRIVIPVQKVTGVSVRVDTFDKAIDIQTGEVVDQWPPPGWRACGSSHSHNSMDAFFSGTDDQYELGDPGLHIVVGKINPNTGAYVCKASITASLRRFMIDPTDVIDFSPNDSFTYDPACLNAITLPKPRSALKPITAPSSWELDHFPQPTQTNSSLRAVDPELINLSRGVSDLIAACKRNGVSTQAALDSLLGEIEDYYDLEITEDPFYWNSYDTV